MKLRKFTDDDIIDVLKKYESPGNPFYESNFSDYLIDIKGEEYEGITFDSLTSSEEVIKDYRNWKTMNC
jgi:hypothetical protein